MATVVNNPQPVQPVQQPSNGGSGFLLGIILVIVLIVLFFYYGLPYLRTGFGGTQINVPDKINVNVQPQK